MPETLLIKMGISYLAYDEGRIQWTIGKNDISIVVWGKKYEENTLTADLIKNEYIQIKVPSLFWTFLPARMACIGNVFTVPLNKQSVW